MINLQHKNGHKKLPTTDIIYASLTKSQQDKFFTEGFIGDLMIDRMIVNILLNLTKVTENARPCQLQSSAIEELLTLCRTKEKVKKTIFHC